jgi:hypothetical protein
MYRCASLTQAYSYTIAHDHNNSNIYPAAGTSSLANSFRFGELEALVRTRNRDVAFFFGKKNNNFFDRRVDKLIHRCVCDNFRQRRMRNRFGFLFFQNEFSNFKFRSNLSIHHVHILYKDYSGRI